MLSFWECFWKTSAAVLVIWGLTVLLRRRSAALRHALWICGLAAFLIVPALVPLARRTPPVPVPVVVHYVPAALDIVQVQSSLPAGPAKTRVSFKQIAVWLWLAGSMTLVIRRTRAALRMYGITRRSSPAPGVSDARISDEVQTPLTWGLFRPLILLPRCALTWSQECLRSVLEHEREHIRRLDPISHWLGELAAAGWWFHPFVWLARSRAAHERECACDDAVLRSGIRASDYATELLNLAATLPKQGDPIMALSALSDFERRIKNLLLPGIDRRPTNARARIAVVVAALALVVPLAVVHAQDPIGQGDLSGVVMDPSGARVPNATIIASRTGGNRETVQANAAGEWTLAGIPAGDYAIQVMAPGFAMLRTTATLAPGQKAKLTQQLALGQVSEMISVVAQGQPRRTAEPTGTGERIRVGGMVQATKLIKQVKPAYPEIAKAQGIEGTVLMNAIIGKDGSLLSLTVMNKLADPDLAAAALDAVKQWRYQPTLLNGEPVEVVTTITVNFKLQ
jgi:TonB family protein